MKQFPNLKTLLTINSGVICSERLTFSDKCQTCYELAFDPFFKQLSSVRKLVIREEDLKPLVNVLFSYDIDLRYLMISRAERLHKNKDIEWLIVQTIMALILMSRRQPNRAFTIQLFRKMPSIELTIPKNLSIIEIF